MYVHEVTDILSAFIEKPPLGWPSGLAIVSQKLLSVMKASELVNQQR